MTIKTMRCVN